MIAFGAAVLSLLWGLRLAVALIRGWDRESLVLATLTHAVFLGFAIFVVGGLLACIVYLIRLVEGIDRGNPSQWLPALIGAIVSAAVCLGSLPLLRALDRYVGRRCIRRHLLRDRYSYY